MRKRIFLPLLALATLLAAEDRITSGMNQFATTTYHELARGTDNIVFSPFNISTALSMALAGARGQTATEMAATLHQPPADAAYHAAVADLVSRLNKSANTAGDELSMANALWLAQGLKILPAFEKTIRDQYGAPPTLLDFSANAEAARARINSWTSDHTKGKIQQLFGPGSIDPRTRLIITSAIYFNGKWSSPFKPTSTNPAPFKLEGGGTTDAKLMHQTDNFDYGETTSLQILQMKYADQSLAFVVLLPKTPDGIGNLEKSLTADNLTGWLAKLSNQRVEVLLPKFRAESEFQLAKALSNMGMKAAFQDSADFSGIDGRRDLFISQVVHKAYVDVSEQGTEAAAATGVSMMPMAIRQPQQHPVFRADHPFVFLIRDTHTGVILFAGRLMNPKS